MASVTRTSIFTLMFFMLIVSIGKANTNIKLSVIFFDNPSGTRYDGRTASGPRKCCDSTAPSTNCTGTNTTCDVFFVFCVGRYERGDCKGQWLVLKPTQNTSLGLGIMAPLSSFTTIADWNHNMTTITAEILHKRPGLSSGLDLVDVLKSRISFSPGRDYLVAKNHVITFNNFVSLTVEVTAWCDRRNFGPDCSSSCDVDPFHPVCINTTVAPVDQSCLDKDLLVLNFSRVFIPPPVSLLQTQLRSFILRFVCDRTTTASNVTLQSITTNKIDQKKFTGDK